MHVSLEGVEARITLDRYEGLQFSSLTPQHRQIISTVGPPDSGVKWRQSTLTVVDMMSFELEIKPSSQPHELPIECLWVL